MSDAAFTGGGVVSGKQMTVRLRRADDCHNGHPLWNINDGPDEHIISGKDMRQGRAPALLACQREVEDRRALDAS